MNNQQCQFILGDTKRCEAKSLKDDRFCFFHSNNPDIIHKRLTASSLGGTNGKSESNCLTYSLELKTVSQVLGLLEVTINNLLNRKISKSEASCVGYLSNILIGAIRDNQLEQRLEVIENALNLSKESSESSR